MSDDQRANYSYFTDITTRWMDNDIYGHVNNVVYYSYFDSVANKYLICLLYTSPSPRDRTRSRMPSSA